MVCIRSEAISFRLTVSLEKLFRLTGSVTVGLNSYISNANQLLLAMSNLAITETITYYHFLNTLYYVYLRHLQVYRCHDIIAISLHLNYNIFTRECNIKPCFTRPYLGQNTSMPLWWTVTDNILSLRPVMNHCLKKLTAIILWNLLPFKLLK